MAKAFEYEVRCPRCDVSFPPGTKKCLHCGGRTAKSLGPGPRMEPDYSATPFDPRMPEHGTHAEDGFARPLPADAEPDEESPVRGGLVRAAVTVLWILAAIAFSVMRACQEG